MYIIYIYITCLLLISYITKISDFADPKRRNVAFSKRPNVFGLAIAGKDLVDHVLAIGGVLGENLGWPHRMGILRGISRRYFLHGSQIWVIFWVMFILVSCIWVVYSG